MKYVLMALCGILFATGYGQYAPSAGTAGSSAIHKDSVVFVSWATHCNIVRGWQNIADTTLGRTTVGDSLAPVGKAGENGVLSLGDGGYAVCTFASPIKNDAGFDFAVFENSFDDSFLELAFVEVSSDGVNFFRFPAHSLTDTATQTASFGLTDAKLLNNLAGKYRANFGTPFDLEEMTGIPGLDITHITHVKIIDVVGSIDNAYATRDTAGNKVNDPFPTPFPSGGFDLDAVGVIHQQPTVSIREVGVVAAVFPNPVKRGSTLFIQGEFPAKVSLFSTEGNMVAVGNTSYIAIPETLAAGCYFVHLFYETEMQVRRIMVE
ncbi:MAG: T9SS type A sorting domain-containing protein [Chitinophagales bacterium]|nr:T9SS type A sorting domain-containing protein [Chitinophagales bacterium]